MAHPARWDHGCLPRSVGVRTVVLVATDLAASAGVAPHLTWLWPLVVDGNIVINTVAGMVLRPRGRGVTWYPWTALIVFAAISVTGNALHAGATTGRAELGVGVAAAVSAVPALALLQSTHLFVLMLSPGSRRADQPAAPRDGHTSDLAPAARSPREIHSGDLTAVARGTNGDSMQSTGQCAVVDDDTDHLASLVRAALVQGHRVTGSDVASWLGTSERTGRRRLLDLATRDKDLGAALRTRPVYVVHADD